MYTNVHSSTIQNSPKMEITQRSVNWWTNKQDVVSDSRTRARRADDAPMWTALKTWCSVTARHKRPHAARRHWEETSRTGKFRETEKGGKRGRGHECGVSLPGDRMFWDWTLVMAAHHCECSKSHTTDTFKWLTRWILRNVNLTSIKNNL